MAPNFDEHFLDLTTAEPFFLQFPFLVQMLKQNKKFDRNPERISINKQEGEQNKFWCM